MQRVIAVSILRKSKSQAADGITPARRFAFKLSVNSSITIQSHGNDRIYTKLQKEIERKIVQIETSDHSILNKSIEASRVLGDAFKRLKEFIISYEFASEEEEILFSRR